MRPVLFFLKLPGLGRVPIPSFVVFVALGYAVGAWGAGAALTEHGWSAMQALGFFSVVVLACVLGAWLLARLVVRFVARLPVGALTSGASMVGGLVAGGTAAALVSAAYDQSVVLMFSACVPWIFIGTAIGRVGCLLAGCDYGRPVETGSRWPAIRYPNWAHESRADTPTGRLGAPAFMDHWSQGRCHPPDTHSLPVHPVPLYWSVSLMVGGLLLLALPAHVALAGLDAPLALIGVWLYTALTWLIEPWRGDVDRGVFRMGIDVAQTVTAAAALAFTLAWLFV